MKRFLLALIVSTPVVILAAPANAQFGGRSAMAQAFEPDVWQRDLPIFAESLELEEWQRPIVEMLVEDYLASFHAGVDAVKQRMMGVQPTGDKPSIEAVLAPIEDWNKEKGQLYTRFLETVRSQLSEQQLQRWPVLERAMRRERLLPQSEISGEGLNLAGLVRDLSPPPEVALAAAPALEAWEIRIDGALLTRQARMEEILPALKEAMAEMNHDRGLQLQDRIMAARVQLRDAQEQGILEIAEAMGPEWGERFRTLAMQRAFAEAFQPSPVMRQYVAALALPELSDEQRSGITNLKQQFQHELDLISEQMLVAIRTQEPKEPRRRVEQARERREPGVRTLQDRPAAGTIEFVRTIRAETNEKYRKLLEDQLTAEQYTSLPGSGKMSASAKDPRGAEAGADRMLRGRAVGGERGGHGGDTRGTGTGSEAPLTDPAAIRPAPSAAE